jgi:hypothetical protein
MELRQLPQFSTTELQSLSALLQEEDGPARAQADRSRVWGFECAARDRRSFFLDAAVLALGLLLGWIIWG